MADRAVIQVEVVSADGIVWEGEALSVVARTTEGDIGILPHHEPFLAALEPGAAEVLAADGRREILAVDGGFISVADNRVAVLSQYGRIARELDLNDAEQEFAETKKLLNEGDSSEETMQRFQRARAQVHAARRAQQAG